MRVKPTQDYWGRLNTGGVTTEMVNSYDAKGKSIASMKVFTTFLIRLFFYSSVKFSPLYFVNLFFSLHLTRRRH